MILSFLEASTGSSFPKTSESELGPRDAYTSRPDHNWYNPVGRAKGNMNEKIKIYLAKLLIELDND